MLFFFIQIPPRSHHTTSTHNIHQDILSFSFQSLSKTNSLTKAISAHNAPPAVAQPAAVNPTAAGPAVTHPAATQPVSANPVAAQGNAGSDSPVKYTLIPITPGAYTASLGSIYNTLLTQLATFTADTKLSLARSQNTLVVLGYDWKKYPLDEGVEMSQYIVGEIDLMRRDKYFLARNRVRVKLWKRELADIPAKVLREIRAGTFAGLAAACRA